MFFHRPTAKVNIYTCKHYAGFRFSLKYSVVIFFLGVLISFSASAQKLDVPIKLEVDKGNTEGILMKVTKNGKDVFSQTGSKNFKLKLDYNETYVLSFSKSGYVTKTIEFNTKAPEERIKQGFEPYKIGVKLFEQQDDNVVMYNQPVGKIRFEESLDDFSFETDYSKSILSAFNDPAAKKDTAAKEQKTKPEETKKEVTAEKKVSTEVKNENVTIDAGIRVAATNVQAPEKKSDEKVTAPAQDMSTPKSASMAAGSDSQKSSAYGSGIDDRIASAGATGSDMLEAPAAPEETFNVTREDIVEKNRVIIKVKVSSSSSDKETNYSVIQYNWGGRYFFKETTSINETLFTHWTGVRP